MGQWPVKATAVTVVVVVVITVAFAVGVFELFAAPADSELTLANACEIAVFNESQSNLIKKTCCKGYDLTQNKTQCRAICKNPCIQGMCISSNVCKCDKNQLRKSCNTYSETQVASDFRMESTGNNCKNTYDCSVNSYCNYADGSCICLPGYTGNNCQYLCSSEFYGERCQFKCQCKNGGLCNVKNGNCICRSGYKGKYCEVSCPMGFYGSSCIRKCKCQNGAKCDGSNGKCTCPVGYTGQYCESLCPPGFFGYKCKNKCMCQHGETCNPVNGVCNCIPGYTGNDCRMDCPSNKYGLNCSLTCTCFNGASCRPSDGVCLCEPGFFGSTCSQGHRYFVGLELEPESEFSVSWIFDFSIVSSILIISSACTWMLFCYFFCYRRQIQKYSQSTLNNIELHKNARMETQISDANMSSSSKMFDVQNMCSDIIHVEKNKSFTNELFYSEYSSIDRLSNDYKEHIYLEIDESVIRRRPDDLYDHLDFLRPTGSWKPHYQKTLAWQEQSSSSSSSTKEYNIT